MLRETVEGKKTENGNSSQGPASGKRVGNFTELAMSFAGYLIKMIAKGNSI